MRRGMLTGFIAALAALPALRRAAAAEPETARSGHRLALHIDQNDPAVMNMALGNAGNAADYFAERGEKLALELVAYGPGLHMLRSDTSPVKTRLSELHAKLPDMILSGCNNTLQGMKRSEGKEIMLLPEARIVPAGIVRLVELQEAGWSYVKP